MFTTILLLLLGCEPNPTRQPSQAAIPATPTPTPGAVALNVGVPLSGKQVVTTAEVQAALLKAGFPQQDIATMLCIGWCESNFNAKAVGDDGPTATGNRYNWGVFQINGVHIKSCGHSTGEELFDLEKNAQCALSIRKKSGFSAWTVYNKSCLQAPADPQKVRCL